MKNSANMIGALFLGMAVGAVIGVLFAPDKGSETRKRITHGAKDTANNFKDKIKSRCNKANGEPEDYLEEYYRNIGLSVGYTRGLA
ncbi:MAG: YtxH domain-containing protein [Bacteroidia bacterium]|nr:YtxH domain-containing protein [Bacteroidia bacterium]